MQRLRGGWPKRRPLFRVSEEGANKNYVLLKIIAQVQAHVGRAQAT